MSSNTNAPSTSPRPSPAGGSSAPVPAGPGAGGLTTSQGSTNIAEAVVSKIAGVAAREVNGIYKLGGGAARALGSLRERIPGASTNVSQGVSVEVGEKQAAVDIDVVVEYGVAIADLAAATRRNVIAAVQRMTGLEVVEVNITVNDVHLPSEDSDDDADNGSGNSRQSSGSRVQ